MYVLLLFPTLSFPSIFFSLRILTSPSLSLPPALTLQAFFLLLCAFFGTTKLTALLLLTLAVGTGGLQLVGHTVSIIEMAPRYAGVIMGIVNSAGTLPGIIGPIIAKQIADAVRNIHIIIILSAQIIFVDVCEISEN